MVVAGSLETLVPIHRITQHHIPRNSNLHVYKRQEVNVYITGMRLTTGWHITGSSTDCNTAV